MKITRLIRFFSCPASYFVGVGILVLFVLFNSLAGCSSRAPLARVFSGFDVTFSRPYENSQAYRVFRRTYDEYALKNKTGAGQKEGATPGPIWFQNHSNPVRYRNVWIQEK